MSSHGLFKYRRWKSSDYQDYGNTKLKDPCSRYVYRKKKLLKKTAKKKDINFENFNFLLPKFQITYLTSNSGKLCNDH